MKFCPICKTEHNDHIAECSTKCRILNRHKKTKDGCWEWIDAVTEEGKGYFVEQVNGKNKYSRAHVRSYEIFVGKRAKSQQVKQKCRNVLCCNPDHLYIEENQLDEDKIKMIRDLHRQGVTYEDLRKKFKISKSHISNIILNRCWKHV